MTTQLCKSVHNGRLAGAGMLSQPVAGGSQLCTQNSLPSGSAIVTQCEPCSLTS
jgi:hypothetical protein